MKNKSMSHDDLWRKLRNVVGDINSSMFGIDSDDIHPMVPKVMNTVGGSLMDTIRDNFEQEFECEWCGGYLDVVEGRCTTKNCYGNEED